MAGVGVDFEALFDGLISHQAASGFFEVVARHEPKNPPGQGITCASWFQRMLPSQRVSGLNVTSLYLEFVTRLYTNMLAEDQDEIDPQVLRATGHLFRLYSEDFELGGRVMEVDLLGSHGQPLEAKAGYLAMGRVLYRVFDVITPLVVADVWDQVP